MFNVKLSASQKYIQLPARVSRATCLDLREEPCGGYVKLESLVEKIVELVSFSWKVGDELEENEVGKLGPKLESTTEVGK